MKKYKEHKTFFTSLALVALFRVRIEQLTMNMLENIYELQ